MLAPGVPHSTRLCGSCGKRRSLPEYREIRGSGSILDAIAQPELSAEITLQPVRRHNVDAAVLFGDIVVPVHATGFGIDVTPEPGQLRSNHFAHTMIYNAAADAEHIQHVTETVDILVNELPASVPLLASQERRSPLRGCLIEVLQVTRINTRKRYYARPRASGMT